MGTKPTTFIPKSQSHGITAFNAVMVARRERGEDASLPCVVDDLASAIAYALFSGLPDPSNEDVARDIMASTTERVVALLLGACGQAEAMMRARH